MKRNATWIVLAAGIVLLAFVVLLAGCGGSDPTTGQPTGSFRQAAAEGGQAETFRPDAAGQVRVLIGFRGPAQAADEAEIVRAGGRVHARFHLVPAIAASVPQAALEGLRRNPRVAYMEPDEPVELIHPVEAKGGKKPPPPSGEQVCYGMQHIKADQVWPTGIVGTLVPVAVIDTGEDYNHEDLAANHDPNNLGYDFEMGNPDPYYSKPSPYGASDHGTHVGGIVAAVRGNNVGVVGAAPAARLYALRCGDGWGDWTSYVVLALEWCVTHGVRVANMSIRTEETQTMNDALQACWNANVVIVAAAGNSGSGTDMVIYPARHPQVIAVAATGKNKRRASFSSQGPAVELAAPGVNILSTLPLNAYGQMSGTSMASPHVAGTAALVIQANPTLTNEQIRSFLIRTAVDLGPSGWDPSYGWGLVDALAAVQAAQGATALALLDWLHWARS